MVRQVKAKSPKVKRKLKLDGGNSPKQPKRRLRSTKHDRSMETDESVTMESNVNKTKQKVRAVKMLKRVKPSKEITIMLHMM